MEHLFHYMAALFTRFLFCIHAMAMIHWFLVKQNNFYYLFLLMIVALFLETLFTVGCRKGHEYSWFCPSMFLYLMTVIPCDWIAKKDVFDCLSLTGETCRNAVNGSKIKDVFNAIRINNDETLLYTMEQALVLILVIGQWLLPKGDISRDQLSQLLLIYIGTAADIMEFTEIIKDKDIRVKMLENSHFVNAVILFWSVSLFQFTLTVYVMEGTAQRLEKEKAKLEKYLKQIKDEKTTKKRNHVAPSPALYTTRKHTGEYSKVRYIHTNRGGLQIKPENPEEKEKENSDEQGKENGCWHRFSTRMDNYLGRMQEYNELISLLIPMLMQDGPFLIMRLIVIAYYNVYHDTLYFLTVKNALVVMLQVYRIFVLYYEPPSEDVDEMFPERNVQMAIKSVQHTRLAIRLVNGLQKQAKWQKAGRVHARCSRPSRKSADLEAARTSITLAQNAGCLDGSYKRTRSNRSSNPLPSSVIEKGLTNFHKPAQ